MSTFDNRGSITIQSTELVLLENELADIGSRSYAYAVDTLIRIAAVGALYSLYAFLELFDEADGVLFFVLNLIPISFYLLYFVVFDAFMYGKSPGKRLAGIRVVKSNGSSLSLLDALSRNLLRMADSLPFGYLVSYIVMFFDSYNRRIGDILSDTLVIYDKTGKGSLENYIEERSLSIRSKMVNVSGVDQLTAAERDIVRKIFTRVMQMNNQSSAAQMVRREELLTKFYEAFKSKIRITGSIDHEQILFEIYRQL